MRRRWIRRVVPTASCWSRAGQAAAQDRVRAEGVVALREPLGGDAVAATVRALFRGFEREDAETLASLVTDDATVLGAARGSRGAGQTGQSGQAGERSVLELWRARLRTVDYGRLAGAEVAQIDRIERFAYADLGGAGEPERPAEMQSGDVLARVPVATPRVGSEQLFGDVVVLLLRRDGLRVQDRRVRRGERTVEPPARAGYDRSHDHGWSLASSTVPIPG